MLYEKGITPACAGHTFYLRLQRLTFWDHPRVCGAYGEHLYFNECETGSPPRVRGILDLFKYASKFYGITPACAGHTCMGACLSRCRGDHPRVCGAYLMFLPPSHPLPGSPPRVRGILSQYDQALKDEGITPACAGHTKGVII